jgi:hypothetical protein
MILTSAAVVTTPVQQLHAMFRVHGRILAIILCLALAPGCTSLRSTIINRFEDDTYAGNSNGDLKRHDMARPYRGVPITIKVPTHVDVKIVETSYMYRGPSDELRELKLTLPHRDVEIATIETDKVFIVDFKRPLSGSLKYKATFGEDQYFDEISGKLEDTTITDVASLVATIVPMFGKPASTTNTLADELIVNKRVVAYRRFDIDAPDFELQVRCFLDEHLNCGHTCVGPAVRSDGTFIGGTASPQEFPATTTGGTEDSVTP